MQSVSAALLLACAAEAQFSNVGNFGNNMAGRVNTGNNMAGRVNTGNVIRTVNPGFGRGFFGAAPVGQQRYVPPASCADITRAYFRQLAATTGEGLQQGLAMHATPDAQFAWYYATGPDVGQGQAEILSKLEPWWQMSPDLAFNVIESMNGVSGTSAYSSVNWEGTSAINGAALGENGSGMCSIKTECRGNKISEMHFFCDFTGFMINGGAMSPTGAADVMSADERRAWFASSNNKVTTRRNARTMTKKQRQACVDSWWAMKEIPSLYDPTMNAYDYFPYNHQKWAGNATHGHPGFGPWHRVFIRQFELEMQRASGDPNLFVPYLDFWDTAALADLLNDNIIGGDGAGPRNEYIVKKGGMANFPAPEKTTIFTPPGDEAFSQEYLTRNIAHVNTPDWFESTIKMPTKQEITDMLNLPVYDCGSMDVSAPRSCSFRVVLEGWPQDENDQYNDDVQTYPWPMHAAFHTYIGGNMDSLASPVDPLFFFLHCAVDRLWYSYQIKHGSSTHPDPDALIGGTTTYETTGANLAGLQMTPRKTFDPVEMGFRYADVFEV